MIQGFSDFISLKVIVAYIFLYDHPTKHTVFNVDGRTFISY